MACDIKEKMNQGIVGNRAEGALNEQNAKEPKIRTT